MKRLTIKEITITGILTALAIVFGMFAQIPFGTGKIYLIGAIIFSSVLLVRFESLIIITITSVVISDLYGGWIANTWISIIAYVPAVSLTYIMSKENYFKLNKIFNYAIWLFISCLYVIVIYFMLELSMFGKSYAITDLMATSIQMAAVFTISVILYQPIEKLKENLKWNY